MGLIGKLVKGVVVMSAYTCGLVAVVGLWDYTQQAKAVDYQYSVEAYKLSVMDRYRAEAELAFGVMDTVTEAAWRGVDFVEETGILEKAGISLPERVVETPQVIFAVGNSAEGSVNDGGAEGPIVVAAAQGVFAPESSLLPRARAAR